MPDLLPYLGQAAYLQLEQFQTLSAVAGEAEGLKATEGVAAAAGLALSKHQGIVAEIRRRGDDPTEAMRPFAVAIEGFRATLVGSDWRETLLAALMGIVSGMGGNAGTQALAVVVRALATNQLTSSNTWWMVLRELRIAAMNGIALGVLIGIGAYFVFGRGDLATVFGLAIFTNNIVAGLAGVLVPITLDRFRIDPAVSSAVFVTTCTDCLGFFSFLGLAMLWGLG